MQSAKSVVSSFLHHDYITTRNHAAPRLARTVGAGGGRLLQGLCPCLLYTSDAADERSSVDLGGRRIIKKKKREEQAGGYYFINKNLQWNKLIAAQDTDKLNIDKTQTVTIESI